MNNGTTDLYGTFMAIVDFVVFPPSIIFQCICMVFLTKEFLKKKSELQQAFYYILYISYMNDFIVNVAYYFNTYLFTEHDLIPYSMGRLVIWYSYTGDGFHEFMFALNRFTALAYPLWHRRIWKGKPLFLLLTLTLMVPFIIDAHSLIYNFNCVIHNLAERCANYRAYLMILYLVTNLTLISASFLLIVFGVYKSAIRGHGGGMSKSTVSKIEQKMVLYAAATTLLFTLRFIGQHLRFKDNGNHIYEAAWLLVYFLHHYFPMFLLPFVNYVYRDAFIKFFMFTKRKHNRVVTVTRIT